MYYKFPTIYLTDESNHSTLIIYQRHRDYLPEAGAVGVLGLITRGSSTAGAD